VAVGSDESAAVAAIHSHEILVRRYVGGQWQDVERIAEDSDSWSGFGQASLAVAPGTSGRALVVYTEGSSRPVICARTFDPGSGWSDPELLGISNEGWWQDPVQPNLVAAMNGKGNAVVVWSGNPDDPSGFFARRFAPDSGFGELEALTLVGVSSAALALHEDDRAVVAWASSQQFGVESRAFDPAAGWGAVEQLDQSAGWKEVSVSVGIGGSTVAVWTRQGSGEDVVETAVRPPMGSWSAPEDLDTGTDGVTKPRVSATVGSGIGGWSSWPTDANCYSDASVRILGADGVWQPEIPVPKLNDGPAAIFNLSANDAGRAVVAWERYELDPCHGKGMNLSWFDAASAAWSYEELEPSVDVGSAEVTLSPGGRALVGWERSGSVLVRWADPPPSP
jgi:hypothetical protein